ncbi:putative prolin-rich extensin-like receptor protein kinase family protein [Iris pallida]|uniref:Prolin-rich extensin-like receptor protein kinase family protein n=1 Tax=Iris pallida TaxID=29817 RepID=A0AAX6DW77_IRIPA|nr:putative prolin-rich extensin-like receptor protein kinase family protein [Iris pallida]
MTVRPESEATLRTPSSSLSVNFLLIRSSSSLPCRVYDENRSPVSLWEIRLAAYFIRLTALAYFCDFICWVLCGLV